MKKEWVFLMLVFSFLGVTSWCSGEQKAVMKAAEVKPGKDASWSFLPPVVAQIGKENIGVQEFLETIGHQAPPPDIPENRLKEMAKQVVNSIIDKKILLRLAATDGVKPSPALVEKEYARMVEKMSPEFLQQLESQLRAQGMTIGDYKQKMIHDPQAQEGLAISTWVNDRVAAKVNITPEEVRKFYQEHKEEFKKPETVKVAHILIRPEDESEAAKKAAQEKAGKILSRLKKGEDFGKIAAQESACPSGKQNQGSLGEFPRGAMVKEFEDVAFNLQPGQLSDVVETKFGCHLIKSETHQPPDYPELSEVAGMIKENITGQKINEELEKVLEEEKNRLTVKILL